MRHPLNRLLRLGRTDDDCRALVGDLEEEYRTRVRPARSWFGREAWYLGQVVLAVWWSLRRSASTSRAPYAWRLGASADIRDTLRRWRHRPGFPLAATLTLGLGIGAATSMFSVVDAVLLKPLGWPEPDRLVRIHAVLPERRSDPRFAATWDRATVHYPAWESLRESASFVDVAVWHPASLSMTIDRARTELVEVMDVSSNLLPLLGVKVIAGRGFSREDDERDTWNLMISEDTWRHYFAGSPDIVGKPSPIAEASDTHTPPWTIVGVYEAGFAFDGARPAVLRPIGVNARPFRQFFAGDFRAIGRLAPGVTYEAASAEAAARIQASQPSVPLGGRIVPLLDEQVGASARPLWVLFGAASVLLLVACANVAGLLVGEHRARRRDTAIRLSLGITPARILRQVVVEHAMLAVAGAAAGLLAAAWLTHGLVGLAPADVPRLDAVGVDWRVALFALGAGGVTLLAFGVAPALGLAGTRAVEVLADGAREGAPVHHRTQRSVVAAEIAMAAVLVVGAGLLGETMFRLLSQPLGFDPSRLVVINTRFTGSDVPDDLRNRTRSDPPLPGGTFKERLDAVREARTAAAVERLAALPGVSHAAAMGEPPFSTSPPPGGTASSSFGQGVLSLTHVEVEGRAGSHDDQASFQPVIGDVIDTLGMPVLEGRALRAGDSRSAALVSREFERRYCPDGAVGRRFEYVWGNQDWMRVTYEIVGVVADVKRVRYTDAPAPTFYAAGPASRFVLRTSGPAEAVLPSIRGALAEADPQIVVTSTTTMATALAGVVAAERFRAALSVAFALAALVLAAVGLYGVAARRVAERRREFGIRVALGARPADLRTLVLRDGALTAGLGLSVGLPVALAASEVTRAFLYGITPASPHVFVGTSVVLVAAALVATFVPARRAGRVDPMRTLRE